MALRLANPVTSSDLLNILKISEKIIPRTQGNSNTGQPNKQNV